MNNKIAKEQIFDLSLLAKLRIEKGYTQSDLSSLTGLSKNYISKIEQGRANLSMIQLLSITEKLGIELKLSVIDKFTFGSKEFVIKKK